MVYVNVVHKKTRSKEMKTYLLGVLYLSIMLFSTTPEIQASSHEHTHIHGEAYLEMILTPQEIYLTLTAPADSLLGFEHTPKTPAEMQQLQQTKTDLNNQTLLEFYEKKGFFRKKTRVRLPQPDTNITFIHNKKNGHSEFKATYHYTNINTENLSNISTGIFNIFKNLHKLTITLITHRKQEEKTLTRKDPDIHL